MNGSLSFIESALFMTLIHSFVVVVVVAVVVVAAWLIYCSRVMPDTVCVYAHRLVLGARLVRHKKRTEDRFARRCRSHDHSEPRLSVCSKGSA